MSFSRGVIFIQAIALKSPTIADVKNETLGSFRKKNIATSVCYLSFLATMNFLVVVWILVDFLKIELFAKLVVVVRTKSGYFRESFRKSLFQKTPGKPFCLKVL